MKNLNKLCDALTLRDKVKYSLLYSHVSGFALTRGPNNATVIPFCESANELESKILKLISPCTPITACIDHLIERRDKLIDPHERLHINRVIGNLRKL